MGSEGALLFCKVSDHKEGKDEMTKASIDLQALRRRIYVKAKAETSWKFWGLYVHVCKLETLRMRRMRWPKGTMGLREVDRGDLQRLSKRRALEAFLEQIADELVEALLIRRCRPGGRKSRRMAARSASFRFLRSATGSWRKGALKLILEPIFEADFQPGVVRIPTRTAQLMKQ